MDIFKDICTNDGVKVGVHEVENEVDISIIFSTNNILQSNDVFMAIQFLQKHNLSESPLCIGGILERVKILF